MMVRLRSRAVPSGMLDDDALDDVGDVLTLVEAVLEQGVQVLETDEVDGIDPVGEELPDRVTRDAVSLVLEPVDLDPVGGEVALRAKTADGVAELQRRITDQRCLPSCSHGYSVDAVHDEGVGDFVDE